MHVILEREVTDAVAVVLPVLCHCLLSNQQPAPSGARFLCDGLQSCVAPVAARFFGVYEVSRTAQVLAGCVCSHGCGHVVSC